LLRWRDSDHPASSCQNILRDSVPVFSQTYSTADDFLQEILEYRLNRNKMLRSRYNQILLRFGFWEFKKEREAGNLFELRSYDLKVSVGISSLYKTKLQSTSLFAENLLTYCASLTICLNIRLL